MEEAFMQFFLGVTSHMSERLMLMLLIGIPLVLGLVVLLVLVSEVSRLRFREHSERLARNIWDDKKAVPDVDWEAQVSLPDAEDSRLRPAKKPLSKKLSTVG